MHLYSAHVPAYAYDAEVEDMSKWAMEQAEENAKILNNPHLLFSSQSAWAPGARHAENYIEGYLRSNPGSRLQSIGTSWFDGRFCSDCQKILNGLPTP